VGWAVEKSDTLSYVPLRTGMSEDRSWILRFASAEEEKGCARTWNGGVGYGLRY
jgi:hypothetical protein